MKVDHQTGFEEKAKFKEALIYMLGHYKGVQTAHLKHILRIFDLELVDRITTRKECIRNLKYTGENERLTNGKIYQSLTFNGSTYEILDNTGAVMLIGSGYFEWMPKIENTEVEK